MPAEKSGGTEMAKGETLAPDSKAAMFLTNAMKGDNSEVRAGKLAAEKGSTQAVRDFGKMLADDHAKAGKEVAALASSMGVQARTATTPEADASYAKLQGLSGAAFDKEFARAAIASHQKGIATYQAEADSKDPAGITDLAKKTLPTLKHHLEAARSLGS